jgi:coenzyme F420-0:L-glutamate ligase/coenzyme F420-1:gamma-L-glutamate ligase
MMSEGSDWKSVIWGRRSVRSFDERPIPDRLIRSLLEAASQAPSAHHRQPWRFSVVQDPDLKTQLARALGRRYREDRLHDGDDEGSIRREMERSFHRITNAPVLVLVCMTMEDMDRYADERRDRAEQLMAVQSVAMAGENLLLAAHANGLGACWVCAPLFAPEDAKSVLGLPPGWEPQGMILLGYPAEVRSKKDRRPVEDVTHWQ